jgi:ABC-2 type transport system permease protein
MRSCWLLLKIQLIDMIGLNRARHSSVLKRRKLWSWAGMAFVFCAVVPAGVIAYMYPVALGLNMIGQIWAFPVLALAVSSMVSLITTITKVNGVLFAFRDYDSVMSMPISTRAVVASRVLALYALNAFFSFAVMLSAGGVYAYFARPRLVFYPFYALSILFAPLIPAILGAIVGALISRISSRFHGMKYINIILLVAALVGIMSVSFISRDNMEIWLFDIGGALGGAIQRVYPLAYLFASAVVDYNALAFSCFLAIPLSLFLAFSWLLGKHIRSINTRMTSVRAKGRYVSGKPQGRRSPLAALYIKEVKRYFASVFYVRTTGFGAIMMLIAAITLKVAGVGPLLAALELAPMYGDMVGAAMPYVFSLIIMTINVTGSSISLEGKYVWLLKSIPQPAIKILWAKALLNVTMALPATIISIALTASALPLSPVNMALMISLPLLSIAFITALGLIVNLKRHRFDWASEMAVVKRGAGAMLPMLAGAIIVGASMYLVFAAPNVPFEWIGAGIIAALDAAMIIWLSKRADALVRALH